MPRIAPASAESDDPRVAKAIQQIEGSGPVWNVTRTIANSPAVLRIFQAFHNELPKTNLSAEDREVIDLEMARLNGCHYCVPAHIKMSRKVGLDETDIKAAVEGRLMNHPRGRLIQELTRRLSESRGKLTDEEFEAFQARGVSKVEMIEVIGEIAHCTLTNYTNRLAGTEFDDFLVDVTI